MNTAKTAATCQPEGNSFGIFENRTTYWFF